jgi:hypothetical protein
MFGAAGGCPEIISIFTVAYKNIVTETKITPGQMAGRLFP